MKGVRAVCDDLGIGAARSIKESIERLETHVKDYALETTAWAGDHGVLIETGGDGEERA